MAACEYVTLAGVVTGNPDTKGKEWAAQYGFSEDASGLFLASVLERYSLLMLRSFEQGETERVQELLYGLTDVCIACHTRLPSSHDSPVAKQFVDSRTIASLPRNPDSTHWSLEVDDGDQATWVLERYDTNWDLLVRFCADWLKPRLS